MKFKALIEGQAFKGEFNIGTNWIDKMQPAGIQMSNSMMKTYYFTLDFPMLLAQKNDVMKLMKLWVEKALNIQNSEKYILECYSIGATFQILPRPNGKDLYYLGLISTDPKNQLNIPLEANVFDIKFCNDIMKLIDENIEAYGTLQNPVLAK